MTPQQYEDRIRELELQLEKKDALIDRLQVTTDQYFAVLEKMPSLAWIKNKDHQLTYLNPAFENAFGIKREDWLNKSGWDLFPEEQAKAMARNDQRVFDTKGIIKVIESVTPTDKTYYYLNYKFPFTSGDNEPYISGISIDITAQIESEKDLTLSYQRVRDLQQSKDKLIGVLSHDLRGPISNLITTTSLLESELCEQEGQFRPDTFDGFRKKAQSVLDFLDNLIEWYRQESRHMEPNPEAVCVSELLATVYHLLAENIRQKQITYTADIDAKLRLNTDKKMLLTVFRNLLSNAIKFVPVGGHINIAATVTDERLFLKFSDDGQGIAKEKQDTLFENLWESALGTAAEKGAGFGLALSKELTGRLGGELSLSESSDKGSTFTLALPLHSKAPDIYQLVYQSAATRAFSAEDIEKQINTFTLKYANRGITGMLIYKDNMFCQLLEGDENTVEDVYHQERLNENHFNVVKMFTCSSPQRLFGQWDMCLFNAHEEDMPAPAIQKIINQPLPAARFLFQFLQQ